MTIRFDVCPVHEPTAVEYERPCVFNDETGRWACAVCGAEGVFKVLSEKEMDGDVVEVAFPEEKLTSPRQHVAPVRTVFSTTDIGHRTDFGIIDADYQGHPLMSEGKIARIGKFKPLVDPESGNKVMSASVFESGIEALTEVLESAKANGDVTVTVKCFESEEK